MHKASKLLLHLQPSMMTKQNTNLTNRLVSQRSFLMNGEKMRKQAKSLAREKKFLAINVQKKSQVLKEGVTTVSFPYNQSINVKFKCIRMISCVSTEKTYVYMAIGTRVKLDLQTSNQLNVMIKLTASKMTKKSRVFSETNICSFYQIKFVSILVCLVKRLL